MNRIKILHIIHQLSQGGASRALLGVAKYSTRLDNFAHRVASLVSAVPAALEMAAANQLTVLDAPGPATLRRELEAADIVHVHFWNTPEIYGLLGSDLPAQRLVLCFHVGGDHPPQIITSELIACADLALASCAHTLALPVFQNLPAAERAAKVGMLYDTPDFERIATVQPRLHQTFNVGYIGTVDPVKMHPHYVPMSAPVQIPQVRFIVCGSGNGFARLAQQARDLNAVEQFEWRGYVEDIQSVLEVLDVFGYPLCRDNYAAGELSLQEAMYAGVPPVIFAYGGAQGLVIHNQTGLIVHSEEEYRQALEYLYSHPAERARLGRNARTYVREHLGAENAARQMNAFYQRLMAQPKAMRKGVRICFDGMEKSAVDRPRVSGAQLFIHSLGGAMPQFLTSMESRPAAELMEAESAIARSTPVVYSADAGGILHYRRCYPEDAYLRLWAGLVLQAQGRCALAAAEFHRAIQLGCDHWRVSWYLAQAAARAGSMPLAQSAIAAVMQAAPDFVEARRWLEHQELAHQD